VSQPQGEVAVYCENPSCPAQLVRRVGHWASVMDIEGFGERLAELFVEHSLLHDVADFYTLQREDILALPGFAEKSTDNLLAAIDAGKDRPLARVLAALGIRGVGSTVADTLSQHFASLQQLREASAEQLQDIPGLGPIIGESIVTFFRNERNRRLLAKLQEAGVRMEREVSASGAAPQPFSGKDFVITGTLPTWSREEAMRFIEARGGRVTSSVSSKTDYLVLGENPGSKVDKARQLQVTVIDQAELQQMAAGEPDGTLSAQQDAGG